MANGYFERGEIYWIGKTGYATLGAVVSSNRDNNSNEYVAVANISGNALSRGVKTEATGRVAYVACASVRVVEKKKFGQFVGKLTASELREIDNHLEEFFDLGYEDSTKDREIEQLKSEVARLKREVEYGKEGILSRAAEVSKYKKLYEKAVDQIADMTLAADVAKRIAEKTAVAEPVEDEEPAEEIEPEVVVAVEETVLVEEEIFEEPPKEPSKITFPTWEPPVEEPKVSEPVKKVNVNEATMNELIDLGFSKPAAGRIVAHRKKYGPFKKVDDLKKVDDVPSKLIRKLKDVLEV